MNDSKKQGFRDFLDDFCMHHYGELTEDTTLPIRFLTTHLTVKEVEAEVIDWVLQYVTSKCPKYLAAHIARRVADSILAMDLQQFVDKDEKSEDETAENRPQTETADNKETQPSIDKTNTKLTNNTVLLISSLAPVVFTKVHNLCEEWTKSLPTYVKPADDSSTTLCHQVSVHAIKNTRRKMEDKHSVLPHLKILYNLKTPDPQAYVGVFDGHGGLHGSQYAAAHYHDNLVKHPAFVTDVGAAMRDAFKITDRGFCEKAERESLGSGTTGVCAVIRDTTLHVSWLGDSEALLVRNGRPVTLVTPHKPNRPDEQKRINDLGGFVEFRNDVYRVNGLISVARAIGDRNLKPFLCADADVMSVTLDGTEDYVVLACDGLWDVVTPTDVVNQVYRHLEETNGDKAATANALVRYAKEQGSDDNITVVVWFFREKITPPQSVESKLCVKTEDKIGDEKKDTEKKNFGAPLAEEEDSLGSVSFESDTKQAGSGTLNSMELLEMSSSSANQNKVSGSSGPLSNQSSNARHALTTLRQITLKISPPSSEDKENIGGKSSSASVKSGNKIKSDNQSNNGSTNSDMLLLAQAAKCVTNKRGRRGRNGRRKNSLKDARRPSHESQNSGIALRTNSGNGAQSRERSSSESKLSANLRAAAKKQENLSTHDGGENMFRMLMGCNPNMVHRSKSQNRWTVAVEMELELAAAMFDDENMANTKNKRKNKK